jgi:hypothetical protein
MQDGDEEHLGEEQLRRLMVSPLGSSGRARYNPAIGQRRGGGGERKKVALAATNIHPLLRSMYCIDSGIHWVVIFVKMGFILP